MGVEEGKQKAMKEGREEGIQKGLQEGREQRIQEGRQAERLAIAKNMILSGMSLDIVRALIALSDEEVAALA